MTVVDNTMMFHFKVGPLCWLFEDIERLGGESVRALHFFLDNFKDNWGRFLRPTFAEDRFLPPISAPSDILGTPESITEYEFTDTALRDGKWTVMLNAYIVLGVSEMELYDDFINASEQYLATLEWMDWSNM